MTSHQKNILFLAISLLMVLLVAYTNHFDNSFHFDDSHTIVDNAHIRNLKNIPDFFTDPTMFSASPDHYSMRPIVTTSLAIDYWLGGGLDPFFFHLSAFIWHVLLCIICYFIYKSMLRSSFQHNWIDYLAMFAVAWFALHTANAETINYIISRSDIISTFFITAAFAIYILFPAKRKWYLYIIPAVLAALTKETAPVLVILLFFYINLFEKKLSIGDLFKRKNFKLVLNTIVMLLPLIIILGAVQYYTISSSQITSSTNIPHPYAYYWLTQSFVWLRYFTAFFFPTHLSADTDWVVILSAFDKRILIGLLFVVGLVVAIFKTSKKPETRPIAFGLIWFAAALLPTSLAPFAEVTNDHRMYFPFVGLAFSVVSYVGRWVIRNAQKIEANKTALTAIGFGCLIILSLNTYGVYQRNKVWHSDETLWADVTKKSPLNGRGLMNYGLTQMAKGNIDEAIAYYERATELTPNYSRLYTNLGIARSLKGDHKEAEMNFSKGIFYGSGSYEAYAYYARYLKDNKRFDQAKLMGERALRINPQSMLVLNILMDVYQNLGLWADLERTAVLVLSILPGDTEGLRYLTAAKEKKPVTAIPDEKLIKKELTAVDFLNLSLAFYNLDNYEKCIEYCKKAIALKPDYADAYSNMAAAYNKLKQWENGVAASKKALEINPKHEYAKGNLAWAMSEKEQ